MEWYWILLIVLGGVALWIILSILLYKPIFKRLYDILLSGVAIIILFPLLAIMIVVGVIAMKGNPFFVQKRPGKNEKIFCLLKFRTMSNKKDENGNLLSNEKRLTKYGRILRSTSLDELPELFNIFVGHMSFVGPRPLLPEYLPFYRDNERIRHKVRPGLTGLAQVNGRNVINSWEERFAFDIKYVQTISLFGDIKILFLTALKVVKRSDVLSGNSVVVGRLDDERREKKN